MSALITNPRNGVASVGLFGGCLRYGLTVKDNRAINVGKIGPESFIAGGVIRFQSTKAAEKLNELPVSATVAPIGSADMLGVQLVLQR